MRILGLDVGSQTIGIAVSDPLGWTAQGLKTWRRSDLREDFEEMKRLVQQYAVERLVVGLPRNMNGSLGPAAVEVQKFAEQLSQELGLEVVLWDERLSTVASERILLEGNVSRRKRKKVIDKMAAVLILQGYLDWLTKSSKG
ncbi:MAG: Holliday junction resolvase RuvX [Syntrophomonadaceae bacterium]|nr:Holliday junction resolvase RuvX [Syntrophomonadaceae bacterium]